jgi:hypothetical protein
MSVSSLEQLTHMSLEQVETQGMEQHQQMVELGDKLVLAHFYKMVEWAHSE